GAPAARRAPRTGGGVSPGAVVVGRDRKPDRPRRRDPWFDTRGGARWIHADRDRPARPLTLTVPPIQGTLLFIVVDEGDNTPLPIGEARLLLPSFRVRL